MSIFCKFYHTKWHWKAYKGSFFNSTIFYYRSPRKDLSCFVFFFFLTWGIDWFIFFFSFYPAFELPNVEYLIQIPEFFALLFPALFASSAGHIDCVFLMHDNIKKEKNVPHPNNKNQSWYLSQNYCTRKKKYDAQFIILYKKASFYYLHLLNFLCARSRKKVNWKKGNFVY